VEELGLKTGGAMYCKVTNEIKAKIREYVEYLPCISLKTVTKNVFEEFGVSIKKKRLFLDVLMILVIH
jgi:hypothetical protein